MELWKLAGNIWPLLLLVALMTELWTGWQRIGGSWACFDSTGYMYSGISSKDYLGSAVMARWRQVVLKVDNDWMCLNGAGEMALRRQAGIQSADIGTTSIVIASWRQACRPAWETYTISMKIIDGSMKTGAWSQWQLVLFKWIWCCTYRLAADCGLVLLWKSTMFS